MAVSTVSIFKIKSPARKPAFSAGVPGNGAITVKLLLRIPISAPIPSKLPDNSCSNFSEISGPDFGVEDTDKAKAEARAIAISKAKEKAKILAKDLDERLGEVIQFNENGGDYYPRMYGVGASSMKAEVSDVTLPQGESVIKSSVTITYSLD